MAEINNTHQFSFGLFTVYLLLITDGVRNASCLQPRPDLIAVYPRTTDSNTKISSGGVTILVKTNAILYLVGLNFSRNNSIFFTTTRAKNGDRCDESFARQDSHVLSQVGSQIYKVDVSLSATGKHYICFRDDVSGVWYHGGTGETVTINVVSHTKLPIWLNVCLLILLLVMSGLFSGLNLGLMALDPTELKVVLNCGSPREQHYAKKILPVRQHGNYLLCTLLLGNVMVNSSLTILLDTLVGSGVIAVVASTVGIVLFGEIVPQSICSRHGLAIGSRTLLLTKLFMLLTFPASYPISKILDFILGEELGTIYNRKQLLEMIKVTAEHNDLAGDEMNIISGVLNYKAKVVEEIMTKIDSCFMLEMDCNLDFTTVTAIMESGHSRIPVYCKERHNIVGLLFVKDLAFVDPDDCIPLKTVIKFYSRPVNFVWNDTNLGELLDSFKEKHSHIAIVQKVNSEGPGDPFYEAIGLVTLEDVIEEMIQSEIVDETDKYVDNTTFAANTQRPLTGNFIVFVSDEKTTLSPQLQLASFQYLSTAVDAFSEDRISPNILKQLLKREDVVTEIKTKDAEKESLILYEKGKVVDYFIMIIHGNVEVNVGMESFTFNQGAFSYFGQDALAAKSRAYVPDYTVAVTEDCLLLKVTNSMYKQALISTKFKLETLDKNDLKDNFLTISNGEHDSSYEDEEDTNSTSTDPFTTPGATPLLPRAVKTKSTHTRV